MSNVTFEMLPEMVAELNEKLDGIMWRLDMQDKLCPPPTGKELLAVNEVAEMLGKSVATVYAMTSEKRIPFRKRGNKLYFFKTEVMEWIESGGQSGVATEQDFNDHLAFLQSSKKHKPRR